MVPVTTNQKYIIIIPLLTISSPYYHHISPINHIIPYVPNHQPEILLTPDSYSPLGSWSVGYLFFAMADKKTRYVGDNPN